MRAESLVGTGRPSVRKAATDPSGNQFGAGIDAQSAPELASAIEAAAQAQSAVVAFAGAATLRQEIETQRVVHGRATWMYQELSKVLDALEVLRLDKLKNLPVAGLLVEDETPTIDGIPWQNVNLLRRMVAILQMCTILPRNVPLLLWDDSEHADEDNRAGLEGGIVAEGYQLVVAKVTDDPELSIEVVLPVAA